jgi:hypothetical protein
MMLMVTGYRASLVYSQSHQQSVQQHLAHDQEQPSEDGLTVLTAAYEAIVPVYKIQVAVVYSTILELELLEEITENIALDYPLPHSSYFRILFRTFISPNAP